MEAIKQHYIIDLSSNNNFVQIAAMQGDGYGVRYIELELIENDKPYVVDATTVDVSIMGTKPDTKEIWNICEVTNEGYILVEITQQMTAVEGRGDYTIVVTHKSQNRQLKSFPFSIFTTKAPFDPSYIESTDEFQRLIAAIDDARSLTIKSISNIGDVNISNLQNNQILKYNSTTHNWENKAAESGGSTVIITPSLSNGTKIADYTINGTNGSLYAPNNEGDSIYYTSPVFCSSGATTCTVTDSNIHTTSFIKMYSQTTSGVSIVHSKIVATEGQAVITFVKSLTENASIILSIYNPTINLKIYGAEWAGTESPVWTRTDKAAAFTDPIPAVNNGNGSSPFDTIMPWAGMQRVDDSDTGTLVSIPKYYYKWTRDGVKMKLQISSSPVEGFFVSPAHADRGDGSGERDVVYVGAYHCATSTYKSTTGVKPQASQTRATFRSNIHNLGTKVWQYDFAMYWTIMMLYLVEYANWNSQATIGRGLSNNNSVENSGFCDSMIYHTGTNAASRSTYGHTRYRYIEDLWGNVSDWCDGIYFSDTNIYCIKNPSAFSDTTGGTNVGTRANTSGFTKTWTNPSASGFEYALYPNSTDKNLYGDTYICDYYYYVSSYATLYVGGDYGHVQDEYFGAFFIDGSSSASTKVSNVGGRLIKLP